MDSRGLWLHPSQIGDLVGFPVRRHGGVVARHDSDNPDECLYAQLFRAWGHGVFGATLLDGDNVIEVDPFFLAKLWEISVGVHYLSDAQCCRCQARQRHFRARLSDRAVCSVCGMERARPALTACAGCEAPTASEQPKA